MRPTPVRPTPVRPTLRRPRTTAVRLSARTGLSVVAVLATLAGCGETSAPEPDVPVAAEAPERPVAARAAQALECVHPVATSGAGDYVDSGLETVQDDPAAAVEDLVRESWVAGVPATGYDVAATDGDRALLTQEHDGRVVVAFVVEDGVTDWSDGRGWGVTSYAACDLAELPPEVAQAQGTEVWTDAEGTPVPTSRVQSSAGPEHCAWQAITFLQVGDRRDGEQYLRDVDGELAEEERTSYAAQVPLPADATDTGWRLDGRELWLVPDRSAAYVVEAGPSVGAPVGERWPGTRGPVACM